MNSKSKKTSTDFYTRKIFFSPEDKGWIGIAPELKGCSAFGDSPREALKELEIAMGLWLEVSAEQGFPIPEPLSLKSQSGRFLLRIPKDLQRELALEAREQGVSLNQFMMYLLAQSGQVSGSLVRATQGEALVRDRVPRRRPRR